MSDFNRWHEYMVTKGYLSNTVNKKLLEFAFEAGIELGYWEGAEYVADLEGVGTSMEPPFWYASED